MTPVGVGAEFTTIADVGWRCRPCLGEQWWRIITHYCKPGAVQWTTRTLSLTTSGRGRSPNTSTVILQTVATVQ